MFSFHKITSYILFAIIFLLLHMPVLAAEANGISASEEEQEGNRELVCPKHLQRRSAEQVMEAHLAAFRSGNAMLIACDYARNAMFIMPGSISQGRASIQATFATFFQNAGPMNSLSVTSLTIHNGAVLMTYQVDSEHVVVSSGVDTLVIDRGRIILHTASLGGFSTR